MLPQQPFAAAKAPAEAASRPAAMEILTSFDFMVEFLLSLKDSGWISFRFNQEEPRWFGKARVIQRRYQQLHQFWL